MTTTTTPAYRPLRLDQIAAVWQCPHCAEVYKDPIGADKVGHFCPRRDGAWRWMRQDPRP